MVNDERKFYVLKRISGDGDINWVSAHRDRYSQFLISVGFSTVFFPDAHIIPSLEFAKQMMDMAVQRDIKSKASIHTYQILQIDIILKDVVVDRTN